MIDTTPIASAPRMLFGDATRHGRPFAKDPSVIRFGERYMARLYLMAVAIVDEPWKSKSLSVSLCLTST
jgi:hypothetical protein